MKTKNVSLVFIVLFLISLNSVNVFAQSSENLLINPSATEGLTGWIFSGISGVINSSIGGVAFYTKDNLENSSYIYQNAQLLNSSQAKYLLLIGYSWINYTVNGSITRHPYLYGYQMNGNNFIYSYMQGQRMLHNKGSNEWQSISGIFPVVENTTVIRYFLMQAYRNGDSPDGSMAIFDDLELRSFDNQLAAEIYRNTYLLNHSETSLCLTNETRNYTCSNGSQVLWCTCNMGDWNCEISPEIQCNNFTNGSTPITPIEPITQPINGSTPITPIPYKIYAKLGEIFKLQLTQPVKIIDYLDANGNPLKITFINVQKSNNAITLRLDFNDENMYMEPTIGESMDIFGANTKFISIDGNWEYATLEVTSVSNQTATTRKIPREATTKAITSLETVKDRAPEQAAGVTNAQDKILAVNTETDKLEKEIDQRGIGYKFKWFFGMVAEQEKEDAVFFKNQSSQLSQTAQLLLQISEQVGEPAKSVLVEQSNKLEQQSQEFLQKAEDKEKHSKGLFSWFGMQ